MTQGRMTYDLRRLRLHGLIARIPGSHRYHVTALGFHVALLFTRVHNRVLRPGLAHLVDPHAGHPCRYDERWSGSTPPSTPSPTKQRSPRET